MKPIYISIRSEETGRRIKELIVEKGYTVKDVQGAMGFENPQAIYKWISGKSMPSLDNIVILSKMLNTEIENILVLDEDIAFSGIIIILIRLLAEVLSCRRHDMECTDRPGMIAQRACRYLSGGAIMSGVKPPVQ